MPSRARRVLDAEIEAGRGTSNSDVAKVLAKADPTEFRSTGTVDLPPPGREQWDFVRRQQADIAQQPRGSYLVTRNHWTQADGTKRTTYQVILSDGTGILKLPSPC